MKLYRRDTHKNGVYKKELEDIPDSYYRYAIGRTLGVHMFPNDDWCSLIELHEEELNYCDQFDLEPPTLQEVELALFRLEKLRMVESKDA